MNKFLSFIRRKVLRVPADRWDYQYGRGEWEGLASESARFNEVIRLIRAHYRTPAILEIGCGKALMLRYMKDQDYTHFTGIDLSEIAIADAKKYETDRARFIAADMQTFVPAGKYDVIAFNESLYYAKDPAAVFERYIPYLNEGGCIIVTAFENKYTAKLWPALQQRWQPTSSSKAREGQLTWNVNMYLPKGE